MPPAKQPKATIELNPEFQAEVNKGGRKPNHTKRPASQVLAGLTAKISFLIETQVMNIETTLETLDKETALKKIITPDVVTSRIELTNSLAGMLKTLTQIQSVRSKVGEEDEEGEGGIAGTGEEIVKDLMRRKNK